MAFLGIGKKSPKNAASPAISAASLKPSKLTAGGAKKAHSPSGELNIYTAILLAGTLALGAGVAAVTLDNLAGVDGTNDEGNPFMAIDSH